VFDYITFPISRNVQESLEDTGMEERMILKGFLANRMGVCRLDLCGSGMVQVAGCYGQGNGPLISKNCGEINRSTNRL